MLGQKIVSILTNVAIKCTEKVVFSLNLNIKGLCYTMKVTVRLPIDSRGCGWPVHFPSLYILSSCQQKNMYHFHASLTF